MNIEFREAIEDDLLVDWDCCLYFWHLRCHSCCQIIFLKRVPVWIMHIIMYSVSLSICSVQTLLIMLVAGDLIYIRVTMTHKLPNIVPLVGCIDHSRAYAFVSF